MISYEGVSPAHRNLAKKAVESLGLTFGAVDIGRKADNSLIVLEVNRAPGLEGNTINAYANAIVRYLATPR
jgi:glutathione synthase/RimK-type ligase-like ATP-grasp enzyme